MCILYSLLKAERSSSFSTEIRVVSKEQVRTKYEAINVISHTSEATIICVPLITKTVTDNADIYSKK
jgi:hypothetical protein